MIGFLRGVLSAKQPPSLLLDVGGVGYEVDAPMSTFYQLPDIGSQVMIFTHLIVREDAHALYGFASESERGLFRALIKVNGVGPRMALGILSGLSAEEFSRCIQQGDTASLQRLPGIGKKTAERLIIEMRDRLPQQNDAALPLASGASVDPLAEAAEALEALGFKPAEAGRLLKKVADEADSVEELIRLALKRVGGGDR
ncbi:MAG: Holliday junction ATP-dependent DNA helicase RuvA [Methylothermaceae bacteria B42]|nr:MAG: Holliday junction ATP-dependent DNA helicase RuvA [Methylothermaceae bacteria B42]HHJ39012.1 Holliday junction branch migration protein RuvA [Methylothermaceae bacterium]